LPRITEAVTIDGATGGAIRIEINGAQALGLGGVSGVTVTGTYATLKSLVVNGFTGNGILLSHETGDPSGGGGNTVIDCLVGTDATGAVAIPNGMGTAAAAGIAVLSPGNLIGTDWSGNVISGNRGRGVLLDGANNQVTGNRIGMILLGTAPLGNQLEGIFVAGGQFSNASAQIVDNTIANNGGNGVDAGYNVVSVLSNQIFSNGGLGIDKAGAGVTANDPAGLRNRPPNYPLLQAATTALNTTVFGEITQSSVTPITLQFFYSTTCDPSHYGEGATYLGSTPVNGGSHVLFRFVYRNLPYHGFLTATATTANGTSEFSACLPI
jgi:hypothetical protein